MHLHLRQNTTFNGLNSSGDNEKEFNGVDDSVKELVIHTTND
jgi:hypothetical protein